MSQPAAVRLPKDAAWGFGEELDALRAQTLASLGEADAQYIRRMIRAQRALVVLARVLIYASLGTLPFWHYSLASWPLFLGLISVGTLLLSFGKIFENMEIGHNIMHGQWDWMRDSAINSATWEWDNVCPSAHWKHSHNVMHHRYTNIVGMDLDIGYSIIRITPMQPWRPAYLFQPLYTVLLALLFEWGVALHDSYHPAQGRAKARRQLMANGRPIAHKVLRQTLKDYVLYPLLAGPFFAYVLAANFTANLLRNVWSFMIIFCGHFPEGAHMFPPDVLDEETRGSWYARQLMGSCNISGGRFFHLASGNLSFQIEHHLFPDLPSNRYKELAPKVQAIAERYGLPYNTGSLLRQFGTTVWKVFALSVPPRKAAPTTKQI